MFGTHYHVLEMLHLEMARLKIENYQSLNCEYHNILFTIQDFDSMLKELPKVKLIKIDVGGIEITDVFFRELGFDTQQIFDYMENAQYNMYAFSFAQSSFIPLQIPLDIYQYDVVCIHQSYKGIIPQLQERFYA